MNDKKLWNIIKSTDVRSGLKEIFSPDELWWMETICSSFIPVKQKIKLLEELKNDKLPKKVIKLINDMIMYYKKGFAFLKKTTPYSMCTMIEYTGCNNNFYGEQISSNSYKSVKDALKDLSDGMICDLDVTYVFSDHVSEVGTLFAGMNNHKPFIFDIFVADEYVKKIGLSVNKMDKIAEETLYCRHPYPFKSDEKLKIKTPIMDKPVYGKLNSELDGNGCWYHFFEGENGEYVDLSYSRMGFIQKFSSLDWIERA